MAKTMERPASTNNIHHPPCDPSNTLSTVSNRPDGQDTHDARADALRARIDALRSDTQQL